MIITRAPLRITLGGGGTDIPAYYTKHGGFCVAAAIDKYVYVSLHETFEPGIILKYSKYEHVKTVDEIQHPIIREALKLVNIPDPHLEIASFADIPAGTGLGSSSAFTCALLKALQAHQDIHTSPDGLASRACEVEIERVGEPIGKQDQYISAHGGLCCFNFCPDGTVEVGRGKQSEFVDDLEQNFMLFYTGQTRSASAVLKAQNGDNLDAIKESGQKALDAIYNANIFDLCDELKRQWQLKLERTPSLSQQIQDWYQLGIKNGAWGGKLVGAGGGGLFLFYSRRSDKERLRAAMFGAGLKEVRFKFDWQGTRVLSE